MYVGGFQKASWLHIYTSTKRASIGMEAGRRRGNAVIAYGYPCRVRVLPDNTVFATFSSDGTTKLWDVQKLEGRNLINKAKLSYSHLGIFFSPFLPSSLPPSLPSSLSLCLFTLYIYVGGPVLTGVFCLNNTAIAAASSNGNIHVFP